MAGRAALRMALIKCGWDGDASLLMGAQGRPSLPPGFTGSITHKDGLALAVAAPIADGWTLGVDSEVVGGRDRSGIAKMILRPNELDRWEAAGRQWPELLEFFSVKEAIYKALHPHLPRYIGFDEAEIDAQRQITMHLADGAGPFCLQAGIRWEDERLISLVRARATTT